jgi:hypothetical protein
VEAAIWKVLGPIYWNGDRCNEENKSGKEKGETCSSYVLRKMTPRTEIGLMMEVVRACETIVCTCNYKRRYFPKDYHRRLNCREYLTFPKALVFIHKAGIRTVFRLSEAVDYFENMSVVFDLRADV